jgi:hypothetical protein
MVAYAYLKVHHLVVNVLRDLMVIVAKIVSQQLHHLIHVFNHPVKMVVYVYHKVHHFCVNVLRDLMVIVAKIVSQQQHHLIHVLKHSAKMVDNVFQLAIVSSDHL